MLSDCLLKLGERIYPTNPLSKSDPDAPFGIFQRIELKSDHCDKDGNPIRTEIISPTGFIRGIRTTFDGYVSTNPPSDYDRDYVENQPD